jgi:transcriptional regulator with XRE-family HTH domain
MSMSTKVVAAAPMVSIVTDALTESLAATLASARRSRGLSAAALAERSGVSRAMIGKVERGEAQPTAALLGRLSGALGLTLSELVARAEAGGPRRLLRRDDQPLWTDPATGYVRRAVSPPGGGPTELVEVLLPPGAEVVYPAESYAFVSHLIWVLEGRLRFREGDVVHDLGSGDCLQLGAPQPCAYVNDSAQPCRYLVVLTRRPG